MKKYLANLWFYIRNDEKTVYIKHEFVSGRGIYGKVRHFNFKNGNIIVSVFDYGMYYHREYSKDQFRFVSKF